MITPLPVRRTDDRIARTSRVHAGRARASDAWLASVRSRRRRGERGMALMLVLLLIVIVTAAGVFATQSAAFEIRSSGFLRQASQTHYVAETGVIASLDELKTNCTAYLAVMHAGAPALGPMYPTLAAPPLQYTFNLADFTPRVTNGGIFIAPALAMGAMTPGSLGTSALQPQFQTIATVLAEQPTPMFGFGVDGGRDLYVPMLAVEFASNGRTTLAGNTNFAANQGGNVTATELARVVALVPCL